MKKDKIIPITCTGTDLIDISQLKPIQGNLKERTREQLIKLRGMIIKYGFSFPIFVWHNQDNYYTLDGHGRDFVCKELVKEGYLFQQKTGEINTKLPVNFIDADSRQNAKEKLLAVSSSFGTITDEGLYEFLFEPDFEINFEEMKNLIDFPQIDLEEFELNYLNEKGENTEEIEQEYFFAFSQEQLKQAIKNNFPTYKKVQDLIDGIIDIPLAMHQFNRLCSGNKNVAKNISLLFNPHRLETRVASRKHSVADSFINKEKGMISSLSQWMSKQHDIVHHSEYIDVASFNTGTQIAHEFKPYLAREIYLKYCDKNCKVLDPCAGWGGRMLGFASSLLKGEYLATDPSTRTFNGLLKLRDFIFSASNFDKPDIKIYNLPFEDLEIPKNYFDFAFTSPPYFNTEIYSEEETQAYNRYKTIDEFNEQFLTTLIDKTMRSLKKDGCFLINIGGSLYRFDRVINDICLKLKLKVREIFDFKIGKGEHIVKKFQGDKLENTIKANDLFFEIRKN